MLIFLNDTMKTIHSHARTAYPRECCGILLGMRKDGRRMVYRVVQTENAAGERHSSTHFVIDPFAVLKAEIAGEQEQLEIVGFYHSHPDRDAVASDEDILHMIAGYSYPIISVKDREYVTVRCFEKALSSDTSAQEEIWIKEK